MDEVDALVILIPLTTSVVELLPAEAVKLPIKLL